MQELPFTSDPSQSFTVPLGASKYLIEARWNDIAQFWTFDITAEPSQVRLVAGIPILIGQDLLAPYALSIGGLVATDTAGTGIDAGVDDLGDRVTVTWLSPDELALIPGPTPLPYVPPAVVVAPPVIVVPPAFTPLALGSTLKLWLRGDLGVTQGGGTASAWADQSGNANNCAEAVNKPSVITGLNGLQGLSFTTTQSLASAVSAVATGSARTIWMVMRNGAGTTGGPFQLKTGTPFFQIMWTSGGVNTDVYTDGVSIATAIPTVSTYDLACQYLMSWDGNTGHDVVVTLNGATPAISHNVGSGTASDSGASGYKVGAGFDGELYEIVVTDTVLSAGNQALLAAYGLSRYGSLP